MKPVDMLRPFWRSIGVAIVKDLHSRPQKAQQLSDLLGLSVNQMLLMTQTSTLPYLVRTKRTDLLQRIAAARGTSIQDICTQPRKHLAAILADLLSQPVNNVEKTSMETLVAVAPAFAENGNDLASWIKLEPVLVACELLKVAAEESETDKARVSMLSSYEPQLTCSVSSCLSSACFTGRREARCAKGGKEAVSLRLLRIAHSWHHGAFLRSPGQSSPDSPPPGAQTLCGSHWRNDQSL